MEEREMGRFQVANLERAEAVTVEMLARATALVERTFPRGHHDPQLTVAIAQVLATNYSAELAYRKVVK